MHAVGRVERGGHVEHVEVFGIAAGQVVHTVVVVVPVAGDPSRPWRGVVAPAPKLPSATVSRHDLGASINVFQIAVIVPGSAGPRMVGLGSFTDGR